MGEVQPEIASGDTSRVMCVALPGADCLTLIDATYRVGAVGSVWIGPDMNDLASLCAALERTWPVSPPLPHSTGPHGTGPHSTGSLGVWVDGPVAAPTISARNEVSAHEPGHSTQAEIVLMARPEVIDGWSAFLDANGAAVTAMPIVLSAFEFDEVLDSHRSGAAARRVQPPLSVVLVGSEAGGFVGETTSFMLLQQVMARVDAMPSDQRPQIWLRGGIGPETAAAAVAGGAAGVIVDSALALARDSGVPRRTKRLLASLDGSETAMLDGHRVLSRPDMAHTRLDHLPAHAQFSCADPSTSFVPIGSDIGVAQRFAREGVTIAGCVSLLNEAMDLLPREAAKQRALDEGSAMALALGSRYGIVQGPMTRVSDVPAFAEAVAGAGAVPFLALALLRGAEIESLLTSAVDRLDGQRWGVGILGFIPPELREEQLAVIRRFRPPFAIIAGGRPSQSAALEAEGIASFLHVPSPNLCARFLDEGARRFIFEGRECGGHVGPRSSFSLWQAQIDTLLEHPRGGEAHVLFAGGIHDQRSVAMVAAMAAPLVRKGAKVGVLAGTAYLFTEEIVRSGAVVERFQSEAIACEQTRLVETSPGHATRCVNTQFVEDFEHRKAELATQGVAVADAWAELEQMNLGRLRVAAKATARIGDALQTVDDATQRRDGMYMIGEVATLRSEVTTAAALHQQMSSGAYSFLDGRLGAQSPDGRVGSIHDREEPVAKPLDIAIIGMECVLPGALNASEFWTNTVLGRNLITEVEPQRWDPAQYFDADVDPRSAGVRTPSKWGGFIPRVPFDALAFGIPPASLAAIEPVQLLSLHVAAKALADAGYEHRAFDRSTTSVVFGAEAGTDLSSTYGFRSLWPSMLGEIPDELDGFLPRLTEDSFPGLLTNVIAGRIANRLDLGGVNFTVDAACASSLAAIDVACKELVAGTSDMVLCGGADLHNGINDYLLFASVHALSPTGQCRTFSDDADGIVLGEGIACVVLKRLADAERDGDRVYAVIKGIAGSSDGRHLGLTAPRKDGQVRALERAYERSGIDPSDVGYVEAHGTGTVVGDRTELATLTELFGAAGMGAGECGVGSVKSQIGHTKCAAGLAGLIRTAMSVYTGVTAPTNNIVTPNGFWDEQTSPFRFDDVATPWLSDRRIAGVSAFGFGGTNFHAILESYGPAELTPRSGADGELGGSEPAHVDHGHVEPGHIDHGHIEHGHIEHGLTVWPTEIVCFSGPNWAAAEMLGRSVLDHLDDPTRLPPTLGEIAVTVWAKRSGSPQFVIVADSMSEFEARLRAIVNDGSCADDSVYVSDPATATQPTAARPNKARPAVAFMYPGQGSQRPRMHNELFVAFPPLRPVLRLGQRWASSIFASSPFSPQDRAQQMARITDTRVAQPTLGIGEMAMTTLLRGLGVTPDFAGGHSYGELVALWAAGSIRSADLLTLSELRGQAILDAAGDDPGTMAAVALAPDATHAAIDQFGFAGKVVVANRNSPRQSVISGPTDAVGSVVELFNERGDRATVLNVACAFHSPVVACAADALAEALRALELSPPGFDVMSNVSAQPYERSVDAVIDGLSAQVREPVRFVEMVEDLYERGVRVFIEVGPGRVLTRQIGLILSDRDHVGICTDVPGESELRSLCHALGQMIAAGVEVDLDMLYDGRVEPIDWNARPKVPKWTVDGHLVRTVSGEPVAGGLRPAIEFVKEFPMGVGIGSQASGDSADAAVLHYLHGMRELVAAQRDVMMSYLGSPVGVSAPIELSTVPALVSGVGMAASTAPVGVGAGPVNAVGDASVVVAEPGRRRLTGDQLIAEITAIVADRTGYPVDMLDSTLDLEADLSIDSIKRIEILGELADRVDLPGADGDEIDESVVEELATIKTIAGIAAWIVAHDADAEPASVADDAEPDAVSAVGLATFAVPAAPLALLPVEIDAVMTSDPLDWSGKVVWVRHAAMPLDDSPDDASQLGGEGAQGTLINVIETICADRGAEVYLVAASADLPDADPAIVIDIAGDSARETYEFVREALLRGAVALGCVSASGSFGSVTADGRDGLWRTIAREYPDVRCRCVRIDTSENAGSNPDLDAATALARALDCVAAPDSPVLTVVAGDTSGTESGEEWIWAQCRGWTLAPGTSDGLHASLPGSPVLGPDSVTVLIGGGRGITSACGLGIAKSFGGRVVLLGRSAPPPADPSPALFNDQGETDDTAAGLRKRLIAAGMTNPREIESNVAALQGESEVRSTLSRYADLGVDATYRSVNATDADALAGELKAIIAEHGRIDLVVHGAGVLADHHIKDKTADEFARVWDTKVAPFEIIDATLGPETAVVMFASISGAVGNVGQADYAAANSALDQLSSATQRPTVAVDWGPWGGGGMVSIELEREYERRGIGVIDPADGVAFVCDQIAQGLPHRQVMYVRADPAALGVTLSASGRF